MNSATLIQRCVGNPLGVARRTEPRPGEVFRYRGPRRIVETAEVLAIHYDWQGIPHVSFRLIVNRANLAQFEALRTLTLSSFRERFRERVVASQVDV